MSGLYRLDADTRPVPDLAEDVKISEDRLTYTFTLRDGIKWSNGDPVTAKDFEYAWKRVLNPDTGAQYAYIISTFVDGADAYNTGKGSADDVAVTATDDKTLEVGLVAPSPFWLGLTAFYTYLPQNQKYIEQQGEDYALSADALLYNGPYTLTQFKPTSGVTMVKNEDYWNKANVPIEKVEGKIVKELDTAVNLYESGELDVQTIDGEFVDEYKDSPEYHTLTFFASFYMVGNQKLPIFQNVNVRKAIQIGYDRDALVNQILKNGSSSAPGFVPFGIAGPGEETFREFVGATQPEFDPAEAKTLFQKGIDELGENPDHRAPSLRRLDLARHSNLPAVAATGQPRGKDRHQGTALRQEAGARSQRRIPAIVAGLDRGLQRPDDLPRPLREHLAVQHPEVLQPRIRRAHLGCQGGTRQKPSAWTCWRRPRGSWSGRTLAPRPCTSRARPGSKNPSSPSSCGNPTAAAGTSACGG